MSPEDRAARLPEQVSRSLAASMAESHSGLGKPPLTSMDRAMLRFNQTDRHPKITLKRSVAMKNQDHVRNLMVAVALGVESFRHWGDFSVTGAISVAVVGSLVGLTVFDIAWERLGL